jgi:hypothetical protein
MPPLSVAARFKSLATYLNAQDEDTIQELQSDACKTAASWLPESLDFEAAAELTSIIRSMAFTSAQKKDLLDKVKNRCLNVLPASVSTGGRVKGQCFMNLPNFFSKAFWKAAPSLSCGQRFGYIVATAIALGGRSLSEYSKALIMLMSLGDTWNRIAHDRASQWESYKSLNAEILRRMAKLPAPLVDIRVLPATWEELPEQLKSSIEACQT